MAAKKLITRRMELAEFSRRVYMLNPEMGTEFEDILKPEYLSHVAAQLRPGDRLEVMPEDMAWIAELLVVNATTTSVQIAVLSEPKALDVAEPELSSDALSAVWKGPQLKWCVLRNSDSEIIQKGLLKADAQKWIESRVGMTINTTEAAA